MISVSSLVLMTFPVAMAFAAANDLFTMRIPNFISLSLVAGFLIVALLTQMPLATFGSNIAIGFAVLGVTFLLFALKLLGGGDAKLIAAGSVWIGADHMIEYLAFVAIFGGLLSLAILGYRKWIPAAALNLPGWAQRLHTPQGPIPYGIAIAAGGLAIFPATDLFLSLIS
jgi:prepilin peptidase CpaA